MKKTELDLKGMSRGQLKAVCPECGPTRRKSSEPSLSVNLDDDVYKCHHCGIEGRFEDAKPSASGYANKTKKIYKTPADNQVGGDLSEKAIEYFKDRGIQKETLDTWKIGYGPTQKIRDPEDPEKILFVDGIPQYKFGVRFPYFEDGKIVWVKHLIPREWNEGRRVLLSFPGGKPIPYGLDNAGGRIVIVEGEIDALSVWQSGVHEVWSVPTGSEGLNWLEFEEVVEKLLAAGEIYIAVDSDEAGQKLETELIRRLNILMGSEKLNLVRWPEGCKDANDTLIQHGPEQVKQCIEEDSQPVPVDGISEANEFAEEFLNFYLNGVPTGVTTGIYGMDEIYRVMPGMNTVVTGISNHGKSEWLDQVIVNMIELHGWKFAFYSPENFPTSLHMIKLAEKYIGKSFDTRRFNAMTYEEADRAREWINENIFYINPRGVTFSVEEIIERARILIYRKGIQGLIIDPWNYVRKDFNGLREDQFINEAMQKVGVFTKDTNVHTWTVVHPKTLHKDKDGKIKMPGMHDLSGGSKFGDNADFLIGVERFPQEAKETQIHRVRVHCQKSRYKYAAVQGSVDLEWDKDCGRISGLQSAVVTVPEDFTGEINEDAF